MLRRIETALLAAMLLAGCSPNDRGGPLDSPNDSMPPNDPLPARTVFPSDNAWNRDVSAEPVDPNSANLIAACGATRSLHPDFGTVWEGAPWGIPYITVRSGQPRVPVTFYYADESDPGPYPIPPDAP